MPDAESDAYCLACGGKDLTVYVHLWLTTGMGINDAVTVGDVVRIRKNGNASLLEVTYVDELMVDGLVPYASTYSAGGQYEGSYRGRKTAWLSQVESIVRRAEA